MRILIFGDSITQGFYDRQGGWAQRLASQYHQQTLQSMMQSGAADYADIEVFNLGVSGDTAEQVLARLDNEVRARVWPDDPVIVVLSIGINDSRKRNNRALVDVYEFQETIEDILTRAQKTVAATLCVGISAVNESLTDPWPFSSSDSQWSNNRINAFEDTLKQSAERFDMPFVPIHDQFLAQLEAGAELLADGLHPNEAGHQLIAELVKPALDSLITKTS